MENPHPRAGLRAIKWKMIWVYLETDPSVIDGNNIQFGAVLCLACKECLGEGIAAQRPDANPGSAYTPIGFRDRFAGHISGFAPTEQGLSSGG